MENLQKVRLRVAGAALHHHRTVDSITVLAVSKGQPAAAIGAAADLGLTHFGENYLQEALPKIVALQARALCWHFIGQLQANKTRAVAEHFDWVHTVDRLKLAQRLSAQRPFHAPPLRVCLQVRVGPELSKGGAEPSAVAELVDAVRSLPRLELRGLMCLPPAEPDFAAQRRWFAELRELRDRLDPGHARLPDLSMGMSDDLEAAIAEGATLVRIGTAIFGPRASTRVESAT